METKSETVTARGLLAEWANQQDGWVRSIVAELLVTRSPLGMESLERVRDLLLVEKDLAVGQADQVVPLVQAKATGSGEAAKFQLDSLFKVNHVNRLAGEQLIEFHPNMTILFGENAAGKSGYCRILKRLANVRSAEEILDDVESKSPGTPSATMRYSLGDKQHELAWDNTPGVAPFGRIAVFDSRAVGLHVDDDLNYQYTPGDLVLFRLCHAAIEGAKSQLETYIEGRRQDVPFSSDVFSRGTKVFAAFESLGSATDPEQLKALAIWDEDREKELQGLVLAVAALQPENQRDRAKAASSDIELFDEVLAALQSTIDFDIAGYRAEVGRLDAARIELESTTIKAFQHMDIPGREHESWRKFIDSAEAFLVATHPTEFPHFGDSCPYCQQPLTDAAVELVRAYRKLVKSKGQVAIDECTTNLAAFASLLSGVHVDALRQKICKRLGDVPDNQTLVASLDAALTSVALLHEGVKQRRAIEDWSVSPQLSELRVKITGLLDTAKKGLAATQQEASERETELANRNARMKELQDRKKLSLHLSTVLKYLEETRWQTKAKAIAKLFTPLLRSLTGVAKHASTTTLHEGFETRFFKECERLRAPKVKLDFPGKKGAAARRKVVAGKHKVSDILSEGEQKVIALADFLAEASLQESSGPVVFDDPVNSLDYRRIDEVVARLHAISEKQQVVVFTHNIWFASLLLERAKKNCLFFHVKDDGEKKGIVTVETSFRDDSLKKIKAAVNEKIQAAGNAAGTVQQALVDSAYDSVRAWCEVAVERGLLRGIVTRYEPIVRITKLGQIRADRLKKAIDAIVPVYDRSCRAIEGHSQPLETLNTRPSLVDLKKDWTTVQEALTAYEAA